VLGARGGDPVVGSVIRDSYHGRILLLLIGLALLGYGAAGYLSFRTDSGVYFLTFLKIAYRPSWHVMIWNDHLPSLLHVAAFSLVTLAILNPTLERALYVPLVWASINLLFEMVQHDIVKEMLFNAQWRGWLPRLFVHYSQRGRFDLYDMFYSLLGAGLVMVGAGMYQMYQKRERLL